jgi:hypothetical protein
MYITFFMDLISLLILMGGFYLIWKQRSRFYSLQPLLPALALVSIGRICDMLVEHPSLRLTNLFGLSPYAFELIFAILGNITDVVGIAVLIYGFIRIINFQQTEQKHIQELETMLPLCSNCKKYRTDDGQWMPIENYLIENGAPPLTHGICPECAAKLYGDIRRPHT